MSSLGVLSSFGPIVLVQLGTNLLPVIRLGDLWLTSIDMRAWRCSENVSLLKFRLVPLGDTVTGV